MTISGHAPRDIVDSYPTGNLFYRMAEGQGKRGLS